MNLNMRDTIKSVHSQFGCFQFTAVHIAGTKEEKTILRRTESAGSERETEKTVSKTESTKELGSW